MIYWIEKTLDGFYTEDGREPTCICYLSPDIKITTNTALIYDTITKLRRDNPQHSYTICHQSWW